MHSAHLASRGVLLGALPERALLQLPCQAASGAKLLQSIGRTAPQLSTIIDRVGKNVSMQQVRLLWGLQQVIALGYQ